MHPTFLEVDLHAVDGGHLLVLELLTRASSSVSRSAATPQVNRSSSSNSTVNRSAATPQVNRSSSSSLHRPSYGASPYDSPSVVKYR